MLSFSELGETSCVKLGGLLDTFEIDALLLILWEVREIGVVEEDGERIAVNGLEDCVEELQETNRVEDVEVDG